VLAEGPAAAHLVGFLRGDGVVALATRLPRSLQTWAGTTLDLPAGTWTDRLTGAVHTGTVEVGAVLGALPVALLVRG
jgi:(1->4)-alpha-D-glucan 1-alpha-D-glucosylmutase